MNCTVLNQCPLILETRQMILRETLLHLYTVSEEMAYLMQNTGIKTPSASQLRR